MERYDVFIRSWWKRNPSWPNGREPHAGKKQYVRRNLSLEEARRWCREYNDTHEPGPLSRKAEFESR